MYINRGIIYCHFIKIIISRIRQSECFKMKSFKAGRLLGAAFISKGIKVWISADI